MLDEIKDKDWFWNPVKKFRKSYIEIGILTFFINIFCPCTSIVFNECL